MKLDPQHLKRLYFELFNALHAETLVLRRIRARKYLVIVNLHEVRPVWDWTVLHPSLFEELLKYVSSRFRVTSFGRLHETADDPRPPLILSFDDGYYDYVEYALPLLHKYRLPSNQNVIVDAVRSGEPPAMSQLSDFLEQAPAALIREIRLPGCNVRLSGDTALDKMRFCAQIAWFLKMRPRGEFSALWEELRATMVRLPTFRPARMMATADIKAAASEHEIGCHSASHESMAFQSDEFFASDLSRCESFFRDELGLPLRIYAFPNGSWRPAQIDVLRRRGVDHVLIVDEDYSSADAHVHKRFTFYASSKSEARGRALGLKADPRGLLRRRREATSATENAAVSRQ